MSSVVGTPLPLEWPEVPLPKVELIESDGIPLETFWHFLQITLLIDFTTYRFRARNDFFVGGNMFLYFNLEQARNRDYRGPDFFYVNGAERHKPRKWWAVWEEGGRYPNAIIELLSATTAKLDRTIKKNLYEGVFRTPEYYCYDPEKKSLEGWHLDSKLCYAPLVANEAGRLWSAELDCWLGSWKGEYMGVPETWLRGFDAQGMLLPTAAEAAAVEITRLNAQIASLQNKPGDQGP